VRACILLHARNDPHGLLAQLESLVAADLDDRTEVVIAADAPTPEVRAILGRLEGSVTVRSTAEPVGRRAALAIAAEAARAELCIALGPCARPEPGFAEALAAAGPEPGLIAPLIVSSGREIAGYLAGPDGSLWPRALADERPAEAAALDCFAANRSFFLDELPEFTVREGHYELHVARAAGGTRIAPRARVRRVSIGPPATVVICTRDREDEVQTCVEALVAHDVLASGCEILIVDNASSDGTAELVRALGGRFGSGVRLVSEPVPGLSQARNTGAGAATHDVLCYLDDDARPAPGWLENLRGAFAYPAVAVAGGPIHALWPPARPSGWPPPGIEGFFSVLSFGDVDAVNAQAWHYGANWAVRRGVVEAIGGFDLDYGASAGRRLGAEETKAGFRIAQLGCGVSAYLTAAAVGHRIDPDRIDESWLQLRAFRNGVENVHLAAGFRPPGPEHTRQLADAAAAQLAQLVPLAGTGDADEALETIAASELPLDARIAAARALGTVVESALVLGRPSWTVAGLTLLLRPEHGRGIVRRPPPARPPALAAHV